MTALLILGGYIILGVALFSALFVFWLADEFEITTESHVSQWVVVCCLGAFFVMIWPIWVILIGMAFLIRAGLRWRNR